MRALLLSLLLSLFSLPAFAAEAITFDRASTIALPGVMPVAGVSMVIVNNGADDRIVGARSTAATSVILQTTYVDKGLIKAKKADAIAIPGNGKSTILNAAGDYVSLMGMTKPVKEGDKIPLILTFEKAGEKTVQVEAVSGEDFTKRFPSEAMGDNLEKAREQTSELSDKGDGKGNWAQRLRDKIRGPKKPDATADAATAPAAVTAPVIAGPMSTPGRVVPMLDDAPKPDDRKNAPKFTITEEDGKLAVKADKAPELPKIDATHPAEAPAKPEVKADAPVSDAVTTTRPPETPAPDAPK